MLSVVRLRRKIIGTIGTVQNPSQNTSRALYALRLADLRSVSAPINLILLSRWNC